MAMDGVDYANALRDIQKDYKERLHRQNQTVQKDLQRERENHSLERKKLAENHKVVQDDLGTKYTRQIQEMSADSAAKVREKQITYRNNLEKTKDAFNEERVNTRRELDKKLDLVTKSFKDSLKNLNGQNQLEKELAEGRYDEKIKLQRREHEKQLASLIDSQQEKIKDANLTNRLRRDEMIEKHVDDMNELNRRYAVREVKKEDLNRKQLSTIKQAHEDELAHIRKQEAQSREVLRKNQNEVIEQLKDSMEKQSEKNRERAVSSTRRLAKTYQTKIDGINERNRIALREKERMIRSLRNRTSDADGAQANFNEALQRDYEKRNEERDQYLADVIRSYQEINDKNQEKFEEGSKDLKEKLTNELRFKEAGFSRALQEINLSNGRDRDRIIEDFQDRMNEEKRSNRETIGRIKEQLGKREKNLTHAFSENIRQMEENHKGQFKSFQVASNLEKSKTLAENQKRAAKFVTDEMSKMRKTRALDLSNYELQLQSLENEKIMGEALLKDRLEKVSERGRLDLNHLQKITVEQKAAAEELAKAELESQEADFKIERQKIQTQQQARVNAMSRKFRRSMASMRNDYETKIREMILDFQKRDVQKDNAFKIERNKMMKSQEMEIATRESQFQNKIQKMVASYEKELDKYKSALLESKAREASNA